MNEFIEPINYVSEKEEPTINIKEILKSASLVLKLKNGVTEEDTIIRISNSKLKSFNARIRFMKKTHQDSKIDMFELAGYSKSRLIVFRKGEKYERRQ